MSKNKGKLKRPLFSTKIKRVGKTKRDKQNKIFTAVIVISLLLFVLHFMFIEAQTLGHDIRYNIFVFCIPLVIGFVSLIIFRWELIRNVYKSPIHVKDIIISTAFLFFAGIVLSYLIFGNLANMCFTYFNNNEAANHEPQMIRCKVSSFNKGRRRGVNSTISFKFKNEYESVAVSKSYMESYLHENPDDYEIQIVARKGIWDYYVVDEWHLEHIK